MIGLSPLCHIPSFVEISPPVPEEKIFKGFLPAIYGHGGHLGHVTSIMSSDFHFLKAFIKSLVHIGNVVSEK